MPSKVYKKKAGMPKKKKGQVKKDLEHRFNGYKGYRIKPSPFPRVLNTRMVFADSRKLSCSLGVATSHTYRANSIWDPDYTGGGRTCDGWPAMNTLYGRYIVTGCKIQVSFNNPEIDGIRVGVRLRTADSQTALGQDTRQLIAAPLTYVSGLSNSGSQKKAFSFFVRPWSLLGLSKLEYMANTSQYSSVMNNNPQPLGFTAAGGSGCTFDVFCIQPDQTLSNAVEYTIKIIYYVTLYNRLYIGAQGA